MSDGGLGFFGGCSDSSDSEVEEAPGLLQCDGFDATSLTVDCFHSTPRCLFENLKVKIVYCFRPIAAQTVKLNRQPSF